MLIPSARAELLRNYQSVLFHDETNPISERRYVFYLLLRPLLQWLKPILVSKGLEPAEAESELFLLCSDIYDRFNPKKSSIVPYLEKQIPWSIGRLARRFKKKEPEFHYDTIQYEMEEEFYWSTPEILIENKFVGKLFTNSEKYVISKILTSDDDKITQVDIAMQLGVSRITVNKHISEIRDKLKTYWRN